MQEQEKQVEINVLIIKSLSYLQCQGPRHINYDNEDTTNEDHGSRSHGGHTSDIDDMVRDGIFLDTSDMRGDRHIYYSSSDSDRHHNHHRYHP